jgi:hypothetical protein
MAYRDEYQAMANRMSTLERELAAARKDAEHARRGRSLPLLDQIRVASPCTAEWDDMQGDLKVRFCGQCSKNVYNLSGMTREEAEALVEEKEGKICVRFYRRFDGTVLTADCPVGLRKLRFRRAIKATAVGFGLLLVGAAWALHRPAAQGEMLMGAPPIAQGQMIAPPVTGGPTVEFKGEMAPPEMGKIAMPHKPTAKMGAVVRNK